MDSGYVDGTNKQMTPSATTPELLPCPFCGGPACMHKTRKYVLPFGPYEYDVSCLRGCTHPFDWYETPEAAAILWNTRFPPAAMRSAD
jgi:restriction alleviation protein Lar